MVIKTNALIYDDRFRKEVQSLQRLGSKVTASVIEDANEARAGHDYGDGIVHDFQVFSLSTKWLLKQRLFVLIHLLEFILRTCVRIYRVKPNVVWIHDPIMMVMIPFLALMRGIGIIDKVVWDHHELPIKRIDQSSFLRRVFGWFCAEADVLIAANQQRLDYLKAHYPGVAKGHKGVIRNYSDKEFIQQPSKPLPDELVSWLNGRDYFLVQSGMVELRNFRAVAEAIIPNDKFPPIVAVGGGNQALIDELKQKYGERFEQRVYMIGKVPQMELTRYLDGAIASIIFYQKAYGINNWLCEPNRLFQALNRNIPVIVGSNPPMAEALGRFKLGVVVDGDGSHAQALVQAIETFLTDFISGEVSDSGLTDDELASIGWEYQDAEINRIINL